MVKKKNPKKTRGNIGTFSFSQVPQAHTLEVTVAAGLLCSFTGYLLVLVPMHFQE